MPTPTEFYRWFSVDERTGKRRRTTYAMTREEAAERLPGAEPDLRTREVRNLPDPGEMRGNVRSPGEAASKPRPSSCAFCDGSGWLCADHPSRHFQHDDCGSEGAPCVCNPTGAVQWRAIYAEAPPDEPPH